MRHREHEYPARPRCLGGGGGWVAQGAGDDQLFEAPAAGEPERAGTQAADGACCQFQHGGSGAGDAELRVHRAGPQAEGAGGVPAGADRVGDDLPGQPGRGNEQGLLECGSVRRGGLVEDRKRRQAVVAEQGVDAQLRAGQVFLDQQRSGRVLAPGGQDAADPCGCPHGLGGVVGAQHALAGAERDSFDHAREPRRGCGLPDGAGGGVRGDDREPGLGDAGGGPQLPLPGLVRCGEDRGGRVVRQPRRAATEAASMSIGASAAMTASTGPQREAISPAA
jgi:hypothetical protein